MAKLIAIIALFACIALALAAEPAKKEAAAASSDLQTANSFYGGGLGYGGYGGYGYPGFYGGYGGYGYPGYFGYRGFYGGYPGGYGGYGFYG